MKSISDDEEIKVNLGKCDTCGEPATVIVTRFARKIGVINLGETVYPADNRERFCKIHTPSIDGAVRTGR